MKKRVGVPSSGLFVNYVLAQTEPDLHLLLTFHNLSAPYTLDCQGAYVEIERENNGFQARWCGNPIGQQRGMRSHVIFARGEVRISVFDGTPESPDTAQHRTGFIADIEVVDLHEADGNPLYSSGAYSSVKRRIG